MTASRGTLWTALFLACTVAHDSAAQAAGDLGTARGCTRSRIGIEGSVAPVTAESHTFLGRFVGSFGRYVQPSMREVRGRVLVGLGGTAPMSVMFSMKRPVSEALLPEQKEDRLTPEQHRTLFTGIRGALAEIQGVPANPFTMTLVLEGGC